MKRKLIIITLIICNTLFAQKKETSEIYGNVRIDLNNEIFECKCSSVLIYNFSKIKGDLLLKYKDVNSLFKKFGKEQSGITSYNQEYTYAQYLSENGNVITIQFFKNKAQGVRFLINENHTIRIF